MLHSIQVFISKRQTMFYQTLVDIFFNKMINKTKAYNCTTYLGRKQNFEKVLCNIKKMK